MAGFITGGLTLGKREGLQGDVIMKATFKKQLDEMTEDEIKSLLRRDYMRRLTRYRMTDDFFKKKYAMDFAEFENKGLIQKQNYSFEVESDAQEWELALDGTKSIEKKLKEISREN
jgi:hypothetical protein